MASPNALVVDIETAKAILNTKRGEQPEINPATGKSYEYVTAFDDHSNPPAVVGVWDCSGESKPVRFFFAEQFDELRKLIERREWIVTFNGDGFDLPKLARAGVEVPKWKSLDLATLLKEATGEFCALGALAESNLVGVGKSGSGADAPLMWQRYIADPKKYFGDIWSLIDYCNHDVWLTWRLYMTALKLGGLKHPKTGTRISIEYRQSEGRFVAFEVKQ